MEGSVIDNHLDTKGQVWRFVKETEMSSGELRFLRVGKKPQLKSGTGLDSRPKERGRGDLESPALLELNALSSAKSPRSAS